VLQLEESRVRPLIDVLRASGEGSGGGGDGDARGLSVAEAEGASVAAEAAHNVALLYDASGNHGEAAAIRRTFLPLL
jgi:hypothetical protein